MEEEEKIFKLKICESCFLLQYWPVWVFNQFYLGNEILGMTLEPVLLLKLQSVISAPMWAQTSPGLMTDGTVPGFLVTF